MAQALFSLQATSRVVHECGERVDPPSAAIIAAVGRIAQGGCQGWHSGGIAHFDQLTATDQPLTELRGDSV